ncbi:hypothetical protein [Nocardia rhizosphaerae]|uniref:SUKH-3 immunity protein of toxin-antitoxin system n=1 Tax=Nocardia rhizosphaerae TaxID=1691571 RepID=A0ABV8L497_9NOCA
MQATGRSGSSRCDAQPHHPWPDWRNGDTAALRAHVGWAVEGVLVDVEHGLWMQGWGERPNNLVEALTAARSHLSRVPKLVPVFAHRYLPSGRRVYGHPVLSVHQTDIIIYGTDLANYITNEFADHGEDGWSISDDWNRPPLVAFWGDLV